TSASQVNGELGIYAQDRWTFKRLTANLGVRYDGYNAGYPDQVLTPAPLQPTRNLSFPGVTGVNVRDLTPRIGTSYDVFGNGKTAFVGQTQTYIDLASNLGGQAEHSQFVDVSLNATLRNGILLQGGVSTGQTATDNCNVLAVAPDVNPVGPPYCHQATNFMG